MALTIKNKERSGVINPMYDCQPCGAQFVGVGIKDCIPLVHGGQGCCTFVRLVFAQHFKENFDIASTSLHESAAILGGMKNVEVGIDTLVKRYPDMRVLPVITTCSTETIGDDVDGVARKATRKIRKEFPNRDLTIIPIHTPSYSGSHVKGYDTAMLAFIQAFAKKGEPNGKLNIFTGWLNPGDVTEVKHILNEMGVDGNILMDTETFDAPMMPDKKTFACGNSSVEDLEAASNAAGTIAFCKYEGGSAAAYLQNEFGVPAVIGPIPIGIENTDILLHNISKMTGKKIPDSLVEERGRALDTIADVAHMFFADKKVAIFGDPDLVIGLAKFCIEVELQPVLLLLGDDNKEYAKDERLKDLEKIANCDMEVICNADLFELEEKFKDKDFHLDLILGHSKGRFIAIDNNVPMVRVGFPTFDRAGLWKQPIIGYRGASILAENMANALFSDMEYKHNKEYILNVW